MVADGFIERVLESVPERGWRACRPGIHRRCGATSALSRPCPAAAKKIAGQAAGRFPTRHYKGCLPGGHPARRATGRKLQLATPGQGHAARPGSMTKTCADGAMASLHDGLLHRRVHALSPGPGSGPRRQPVPSAHAHALPTGTSIRVIDHTARSVPNDRSLPEFDCSSGMSD